MTGLIARLRLFRHKLLYGLLEDSRFKISRVGDPCAWHLCLTGLNKNSTVISAGAGGDISFEIELHRATGASVILLDPSPTGQKTVAGIPPEHMTGIRFLPYGLAAKSSTREFALPADAFEGSYALNQGGRETVTFECRSVKDLMQENGFQRLDLLKMDIEGFEWEVLREIHNQQLNITQICVEFHGMHGRIRSGWQRYRTIIEMRLRGYRLISHNGIGDHTFMRRGFAST